MPSRGKPIRERVTDRTVAAVEQTLALPLTYVFGGDRVKLGGYGTTTSVCTSSSCYSPYMLDMDSVSGFDWDEANAGKVEARGFTGADVERAFLNGRGTYFPDVGHSEGEERFWLIGVTDDGRHITVPFTVRHGMIRPITAWTTKKKYRRWVR